MKFYVSLGTLAFRLLNHRRGHVAAARRRVEAARAALRLPTLASLQERAASREAVRASKRFPVTPIVSAPIAYRHQRRADPGNDAPSAGRPGGRSQHPPGLTLTSLLKKQAMANQQHTSLPSSRCQALVFGAAALVAGAGFAGSATAAGSDDAELFAAEATRRRPARDGRGRNVRVATRNQRRLARLLQRRRFH